MSDRKDRIDPSTENQPSLDEVSSLEELRAQHEPHILDDPPADQEVVSAQDVADAIRGVRDLSEPLLPIGSSAPLFKLPMSSGAEFDLESVSSCGPVILNFVSENMDSSLEHHLQILRRWQTEIEARAVVPRRITILVISPLPMEALRTEVSRFGVMALYGSDEDHTVACKYQATLEGEVFSQPATFLIDTDGSIRIAFAGRTRSAA